MHAVSIEFGVTLFSLTNEWLSRRFTLPEMIDEVGRCGIGPGVEIIGFQSLRGFPNRVAAADLRALRDALERNELVPTSFATSADIARRAGAWMDVDDTVAYLRPQIELAAELGFPVIRIQVGLLPAVIEKLEPIAARADVHLGMEIQAPEGPNTPNILATRELYARIGSQHLGFIPDFSVCMRAIPAGLLARLRQLGMSTAGIDALVRAWESPGAPFARYAAFVQKANEMQEPQRPVDEAILVFTLIGRQNPEDWREILPLVRHFHGKFFDIDADLVSPSIDYEALMKLFGEADATLSMSSEWEGHAYLGAGEQDAFAIVARHHAMCRKFLEQANGANRLE